VLHFTYSDANEGGKNRAGFVIGEVESTLTDSYTSSDRTRSAITKIFGVFEQNIPNPTRYDHRDTV
jgi:hypothetical protein